MGIEECLDFYLLEPHWDHLLVVLFFGRRENPSWPSADAVDAFRRIEVMLSSIADRQERISRTHGYPELRVPVGTQERLA